MDALRGLAVLMVMWFHSWGLVSEQAGPPVGAVTVVNQAMDPFRMPLLMFLSGMLLTRSLRKPSGRYLRGKLGGIVWPYLVWSVLTVTATSLDAGTVDAGALGSILYAPPTYHWYLAYLAVFYVLGLALPPAARTVLVPIALAVSAVPVVQGTPRQFLFLLGFFLAGDLVARAWPRSRLVDAWWFVSLCAVAGLGVAVASVLGVETRYELAWAPGVVAAVFAVRPALRRLAATRAGRPLVTIGQHSLVYYVSHYLVIALGIRVLQRAGLESPTLLWAMLMALALLAGWAMVRLRTVPAVSALFQWPAARRRPAVAGT